MNRMLFRGGLATLVLVVLSLFSSLYVVSESDQVLVVRLGRPIGVVSKPGLHAKLPFIDTITRYDSKLHALEPPTEPIILGDQKRIEVDSYTQFRIADPLRFNQSVQTLDQARSRMVQMVSSSMRRVLGEVALPALLSTERDAVIGKVRSYVADTARPLGIEVVDVRIERADLPPETSQAIYDRMTSERKREATELRAQGFEWAQQIDAQANHDRTVIVAEAQLKARNARAEGDAAASHLLAVAFSRDPAFFAFYRAMESYRNALADAQPTLVLAPDSELLKFFNTAGPAGMPPMPGARP